MKSLSLLLLTSFYLLSPLQAAPDYLNEITNAIKSGEVKSISKFFGSTVDLSILATEDIYSKTQAEQILKDFFSKNPPKSFQILHKGISKEGAQYVIGNLGTVSGMTYRIYFFVKPAGQSCIIQELRFQKE